MKKKGKIILTRDEVQGQNRKQRLKTLNSSSKKVLEIFEELKTNQRYKQSNKDIQNKSANMKSFSRIQNISQKSSKRLQTVKYSDFKSYSFTDLSNSSFDITIPPAGGIGGFGGRDIKEIGGIGDSKGSMNNSIGFNNEGDSSGLIKIPQAGSLKSKFNSKEDGSKVEDSKPLIPMSESIWGVNVPKPHIFGQSLSTIEDQIISGEGLSSLEVFRQFTKINLLFDNKLKTKDVFQAFSFLVCQLLGLSESGRQKLLEIKDASFTMSFEPKLYQSQWKTIKTHGGDDIDDMQIKRLFLEYLIKIFENEKSVPILEWYFVLADILTMIIREFIRLRIGVKQGERFELAAKSQEAGHIYPFYQEALGLRYERQGNQHIFQREGRRLIIEETAEDGYLSWIQ